MFLEKLFLFLFMWLCDNVGKIIVVMVMLNKLSGNFSNWLE